MSVEIVALIYKSADYLKMIWEQLQETQQNNVRIVANDANEKVLQYLKINNIKHTIYNDPKPNDYYLNRVYRCWNFCATSSNESIICFVNSDMVFSKGWLDPLVKAHNDGLLPVSRLVESGKMLSGTYGVSKNFGRGPKSMDYAGWNDFANSIKVCKTEVGGLFMPVMFDRNEFIESGMYPEGNVYSDGIGTRNGNVIESGDAWFFRKFSERTGRKHVTCFDSLVYHIQEGEKDE